MTAACPACAVAPTAVEYAAPANAVQLSVPAIRCAACISTIEDKLNSMPDVRGARVNLTQKRVNVQTDLPWERLAAALADVGYDAHLLDPAALGQERDAIGRDLIMRLGVAGFAMMNVMLLSVAVWSGATGATRDLFHLISAAIAVPAVIYSAQPFILSARRALQARQLNMDVPIALAILLAAAMSLYEALHGGRHAYFDAALSLTFFLLIGRYLEHKTRAAARSAAKELAALEVHTALRKIGATTQTVPITSLQVGDIIHVPTGVRIPVDGTLLDRSASTDRSFLTGESDPVAHGPKAKLRAGETNIAAPFDMRADAVGSDTRLHQIAELVETAENARNRFTSLADRAARIYAPAVHLLAAVTFIGWLIATQDLRHSLNVAIAVLIITCPCALGLAVPAVSTAAISRLYRMGFLVKSGTALERLAEVQTVILDKTGTLTRPGFTFDLQSLPSEVRSVAKALAQASSHPISKSLNAYLADDTAAQITDIQETPGCGTRATWQGQRAGLGRAEWLGARGTHIALQIADKTYALDHTETALDGALELSRGLDAGGFEVQILSGDTAEKTEKLARSLQVASYKATMSPEDKNAHIQSLDRSGIKACMVGDGLNDTVALASAHASVAPGSALDAARNAADVVMLGNKLSDLPRLFEIARRAVSLSRQNFAIAIAYNAIAIPIAAAGFATPLMAALAMSLSSISVLINALRVGVGK